MYGFDNPLIVRDPNPGYSAADLANFAAAEFGPAGEALTIFDDYTNAATRNIAGQDITIKTS